MEKFDVIIVGGGLAGLAAAYTLAKEGVAALVLERGDYSGAKNVTGGRMYLNPVRNLLPDIFDQAPLERFVTHEKITMIADDSSTTIEYNSGKFGQKPHHSYTVLRAKFDAWLADQVAAAGGIVVTKTRVDSLIVENGVIKGIVAGGDSIGADVVIAADGVMSLISEKAGLKEPHKPEDFAVGVKEIINLPAKTIEDRFSLNAGEGAAQLFMGTISKGLFGGGFLYTNQESVSLGLVVKISDLAEAEPPIELSVLMEEYKKNPVVARLIEGGEATEYSAHVIPEGGYHVLPQLYSSGLLVTGDAAGFALNTGITVRGMEFALASGVYAARTIIDARKNNDFSAASLSAYERALKESFVLQDLETFKDAPGFMDNPRLFTTYPQMICDIFEKLMYIGDKPKQKLSSTAIAEVRKNLGWNMVKEVIGAFRL